MIRKINEINLLDINKHILAYIYNLDESWQSGSHWVALYCNFKTCEIYFFDSYGLRPHKDIRKMIRSKCYEGRGGLYYLIPQFKQYKKEGILSEKDPTSGV